MIHDGAHALVVDPGDAAVVEQALRSLSLRLAGILVTHHHADHTAGIDALRPLLQGVVYGPATEKIPQPCQPLQQGDAFQVLGMPVSVLSVPGHTAGHIAYVVQAPAAAPWLFCGDTLFSAGCGRLFEGTAAQMHNSLSKLAALPDHTLVYCTHEYTLSNLRFAAAVEPGNPAIAAHTQWASRQREAALPTLPSTIATERRINPFLRCTVPEVVRMAVQRGAEREDPASVLAALRTWKNHFA